jgi:hypothetical protein
MNNRISKLNFRTVWFVFLSTLFLSSIACGQASEVKLIPGTELVGYNGGFDVITISPDERWLFFWEDNTDRLTPEEKEKKVSPIRICSIDLETHEKTVHSIDNLPTSAISDAYPNKWEEVASSFCAASWSKGLCYIDMPSRWRSRDILFRPGQPEAEIANLPDQRICSDCAPAIIDEELAIKLVGRANIRSFRSYTVSYRNGILSDYVYYSEQTDGASVVYRYGSDSTRVEVFRCSKATKNTFIPKLRISPDEKYLAYVLYSKFRSPVPLPDLKREVFIRNLETGQNILVESFRLAGNMIWSSDSSRLYISGSGERSGVFRLDVEVLFGD